MKTAVVLFLSATPLWAEPWVDYELLMRQHADQVVVTASSDGSQTRRLELESGVSVTCDKDGCVGMDGTIGAVGCSWAIVSAIRATVEACNLPDDGRIAELIALHQRLTAFVAQNAVPPRPVSAIEDDYRKELARTRQALQAAGTDGCAQATAPGSDAMLMFEMMVASLADRAAWDTLLATPRPPVMNPCL